ncbi:MAG: hypothetical protein CTY30_04245 [Methylocystis sp.]|nr:MAG: hypothetical protein CTY30_04245 [Methylocystis sp.]
MELSVWSTYFTKNKENARRLYEDAGRDVLDILSSFEKWGRATEQSSDWVMPLTGEMQNLSQRAAAQGIEILEGPYKRVAQAASDCGSGFSNHFSLCYKMLSKFAHPTAMQILGAPDEAKHALQRACFFSQGCLFFTGAFVALEGEDSSETVHKPRLL